MNLKIGILLIGLLVMSSFHHRATRNITGKVISADDGLGLPGVNVTLKGTATGTTTNALGEYQLSVPDAGGTLVFSFVGFQTKEVKTGSKDIVNVTMVIDRAQLSEVVVTGYLQGRVAGVQSTRRDKKAEVYSQYAPADYNSINWQQPQHQNSEEYKGLEENTFKVALNEPLSTFSIDVDAASYSNLRRFINNGQRPPAEAIRIEEMVNYFNYDYEQPKGKDPFAIHTEISTAPWNTKHKLVHIGLQGKSIPTEDLPPSNLVFLIDVSGSMSDANKLPLLKSSFKMLVEELRPEDHVSIVVYAGAAGLVLEPTSGKEKNKILNALNKLQSGGSTAGGAGIELAYATAKDHFIKGGNNRVILATDGDFNVGASSNDSMEKLIEQKRKDGIFLTVLGFGMGNYKDSKMEILADKGNGNYAYIDNITEARKVLVNEFGGTLFTIAKDVKLQIEFNPAKVKAYRLIGYENRMLKSEDFNNDKKDAGELGSGHTVTALYEIIPVGVSSDFSVDDLKYQSNKKQEVVKNSSNEIMTIKFRYKKPDEDDSKLIVHPLMDSHTPLAETSDNFRWSASVAGFGMLLKDSDYIKKFNYDDVAQLAEGARGKDKEGYRVEFINMVKSFGLIASK